MPPGLVPALSSVLTLPDPSHALPLLLSPLALVLLVFPFAWPLRGPLTPSGLLNSRLSTPMHCRTTCPSERVGQTGTRS